MTNYHDRPEVSASKLKLMCQGWRHYEAAEITKELDEQSKAKKLGAAAHTALLEPNEFERRYFVPPPNDAGVPALTMEGCREACRIHNVKGYSKFKRDELIEFVRKELPGFKFWDDILDEMAGSRERVTSDDVAICQELPKRCRRDPAIAKLLDITGTVEAEFYWSCTETGIACRAKMDKVLMVNGSRIVLDIKTTQDARQDPFAKTIGQYRYDIQAAHYLDAFVDEIPTAFIFLAIETASPFRCRLYELHPSELDAARNKRIELLIEHERRKLSGDWSEPGEGTVTTVFLPRYHQLGN